MKSLGDLLKAVVMDKKEVVVGTVDLSFIEHLDKVETDAAELQDNILIEAEAFIEKLKENNKHMIKVLERRQKEAWKKILIAAEIPESEHEKKYSINKDTGEIKRIDMEIDPRLKEAFMSGENPFKKA